MKLAPGPTGGGREFLAELRKSGWPDPIELWNKYASDSGASIIEENITDAKVYSEPSALSGMEVYVENQLRITTGLFPGSPRIVFKMNFRVKHSSIMESDTLYYPTPRGGAWLDDVEVGEFELHTSGHSNVKAYYDTKWYPAVEPRPISVFSTIPSAGRSTTGSPAYDKFKEAHFEWDDWTPPTPEELDFSMPTIPAPGKGRSLREDIARTNAEREMRKKLQAHKPRCAPMLSADNKVTCPCQSAPDALWCESSDIFTRNPATLNTLAHRIAPGGFPPMDGTEGFLPWTHGYFDLPVFFARVMYEGDTISGRVNVSERHSGLSIEVASNRSESLQTAIDMYLAYYKATLDMLFIGDVIKDIKREIGSLDDLSVLGRVPFSQCPSIQHIPHRDRLMSVKILSSMENGTSPEDIILSEAWSITFNGRCTVCMESKFVVPTDDLV